ncbi:uncharacterized protein AC631_00089 [Debaryomyces fabryi]|uniref:Ribosomal lysine N-methyltransferase 4 n=1 Tax=Debaryomyces fabryi TaxID=58627 RepID=A0A0V1Q781_9ASCO|nr:uncharacterized protein AC631_00089 [Debaryomyces fabryi]KSA04218.1 hypothetical protein AC631_00089 [Debaryomyces fabryi]CUM46277.1 unnamed protein product [Debaryomyces fabryi]
MLSFDEITNKFLKWLSEENVSISPKLAVKDLRKDNQGRGMVAIEDIEEDEELFCIPRETIINIENCSLTKENPKALDGLLNLNQWESLIISLLYELKVKGEESRWCDYFNTLPIKDTQNYQFNQLMFWSQEQLNELSPSLIIDRIGKDEAENMFNKLFPKVVKDLNIPELFDVTIDEYHKVASLIMSYSFDVERPDSDQLEDEEEEEEEEEGNGADGTILNDGYYKSMVPLADILNADTKLHNASLIYTSGVLVMKSIKSIKKGEQIYNTYSDHPNSEILRRYGYVEVNGSKFDFGEIPLNTIKEYFINTVGLPPSLIDDTFEVLDKLAEDDEEENFAKVVLDSYDCFNDYEIILELIFVIQILSIIGLIYKTDFSDLEDHENKYSLISRISKKCYQLIESKKLTKYFLENYENIVKSRIQEYIYKIDHNSQTGTITTRGEMAKIVLQSEYDSLNNCLDFDKVFNAEEGSYKFIDDGKLIRNITKKRMMEADANPNIKKSKLK